jgi:hypothetical protein
LQVVAQLVHIGLFEQIGTVGVGPLDQEFRQFILNSAVTPPPRADFAAAKVAKVS